MLTQKMEIPIGFFEVGAVIDVEYPYEDGNKKKLRPAVIIDISNEKITAFALKVTSSEKYQDTSKYPFSVEVTDLQIAGLSKPSWVLTDKELRINKNCKLYLRGHLADNDLEKVKMIRQVAVISGRVTQQDYDEED